MEKPQITFMYILDVDKICLCYKQYHCVLKHTIYDYKNNAKI